MPEAFYSPKEKILFTVVGYFPDYLATLEKAEWLVSQATAFASYAGAESTLVKDYVVTDSRRFKGMIVLRVDNYSLPKEVEAFDIGEFWTMRTWLEN